MKSTIPVMYTREAVLTAQECADGLRVSKRTLERAGFPAVYIGTQSPRYIWGMILDECARRARHSEDAA